MEVVTGCVVTIAALIILILSLAGIAVCGVPTFITALLLFAVVGSVACAASATGAVMSSFVKMVSIIVAVFPRVAKLSGQKALVVSLQYHLMPFTASASANPYAQ